MFASGSQFEDPNLHVKVDTSSLRSPFRVHDPVSIQLGKSEEEPERIVLQGTSQTAPFEKGHPMTY